MGSFKSQVQHPRQRESKGKCEMKNLKLMADYQCHPLWDMSPGMYGDIDPNTLPISTELRQKIADWARFFDESLDIEDPVNSGFNSDEIKAEFKVQGIKLAEQLQQELGSEFVVSFTV